MKLTKERLKEIIHEELEKALEEQDPAKTEEEEERRWPEKYPGSKEGPSEFLKLKSPVEGPLAHTPPGRMPPAFPKKKTPKKQ